MLNILFELSVNLKINTWLGQQSDGAGNFGGATRLDGSNDRQSPRGAHGGDKQVSCDDGTQTSCNSHVVGVAFLFKDGGAKQFGRPHQRFEHLGWPFIQMHALQFASS